MTRGTPTSLESARHTVRARRTRRGPTTLHVLAGFFVFGALATFAGDSSAAQAQWDERAVEDGVEYRLLNDEGAEIVLLCTDQEMRTRFVFAEPIESAAGALLIGEAASVESGSHRSPHVRRSFPVAQLDTRTVEVVRGRGLNFTLRLLGAAARVHVRSAGGRASFEVSGSNSILSQCAGAEEMARRSYGVSAYGRLVGSKVFSQSVVINPLTNESSRE